jgi:branched-chain amino acid transport system permease protein
MRTHVFMLVLSFLGAALYFVFRYVGNDYLFFAGYTVLQFVVMATAWNILGGYCGYVNFGSAGFFAIGVYSSVCLHTIGEKVDDLFPDFLLAPMHLLFPLPLPILVVVAGALAGLVGLGMGYLTLRLRGVFFAIATLALAVVLETFIVNWPFVGGARGAYVTAPNEVPFFGAHIQFLFVLMLVLVVVALTTARLIERSRLGVGLAAIRDDELSAEASGVPTLRMKLIATVISGALFGMAGAPFPYYIGYVEPGSAFNLSYAVNSIAMSMIGGTTFWAGPMIGALLLSTLQQVVTVTISSAVNLLITGLLLIGFVILAPRGIVGLWQSWMSKAKGPDS